MPYVGPQPKLGRNREVDDISSGFNGSTTAFTLQVSGSNVSPGTANDIVVSLGGVVQNPNQDFTIAGSTITFTTAPASGLSFFAVVLGQSIDSSVVTPADGSVTTAKLADDAVTAAKLAKPIDLADNEKIRFGTGNDLSIYHDASNSIIEDSGTGGLVLATSKLNVNNAANNEIMITATQDGTVELYHNNVKKIETAAGGISLTGGAAANITALSDGATITIDMATACHHSVTLGGNRTFAAPSNQVVGQAGSIFITQDGSGSRTAAFNSAFKFVGGTAPTLTTTASATDRIDYIIKSSNVIHCAVSLDVK
tara:strand:+ start:1089 stop:2021 length:933 start_codon:yes stop_codon:yes gene_type:complete